MEMGVVNDPAVQLPVSRQVPVGRRRTNPLRPFDITPPHVIEAAKRVFSRLRLPGYRSPRH
jgi:hypothetical protein